MKIITTYFEPFGGRITNASKDIVKSLEYENFELPVGFEKIEEVLNQIFKKEFDLLILFGEAGKYQDIKVETVAKNIADGKDNYGIIKKNEEIIKNHPDLKTKINLNNIDNLSTDCGKYLCNYAYFYSLYYNIKCIFIHIPYIDSKATNGKINTLEKLVTKVKSIISKIEEGN